jgi:signal transduction histidine kinase/ligand-binding sensor domain-containing protein
MLFKILIVFLGFSTFCCAQEVPSLYFKHLNSQNGLSDPNIRYLQTDHLGYLWIGTYNGLNRFDGKNCITFYENLEDSLSLKGSIVNKILPSQNHNMWFGTSKGLSFYDYKRGGFYYYHFPQINMGNNYYASPFFVGGDGTVWSNLAGGIYTIKDGVPKVITFKTSGKTFYNLERKTSLPWILTPSSSKGVYVHYLEDDKVIATKEYFNAKPAYKIIEALVSSDSLVWLSSESGLIKLNPHSGIYTLFPTQSSLTDIARHKDWLFIGSNGEGLLVFDVKLEKFIGSYKHHPTNPASIAGNHVDKVFIDKNDNIFVNSIGKGLDYTNLNPAAFEHILNTGQSHDLQFDNSISSILQLDNGDIWCASKQSGILVYDSSFTRIKARLLKDKGVNKIVRLGTKGLLIELKDFKFLFYSFSNTSFEPIESTYLNLGITSVTYEKDDFLLTSPYGVVKFDNNKNIELLGYIADQLEWQHTSFMFKIDATFSLIQTYATNLYLLEKRDDRFQVNKEISRTSFNIHNALMIDSTIYLATSEGVYTYDIVTQSLSNNPLIRAYCTDILYDNTLWVNSNTGMYSLDIHSGAVRTFSKYDGIQGTVFNSGTLVKLHSGKILTGGSNGVNLFDPQNVTKETQRVSAFITEIFINDISYTDQNPITLNSLDLDYKSNTITFHVSPLDFQNSAAYKIHYQMVGYDPEPVEATEAMEFRYAKIPPGSYTFKVFVDGVLSPNLVHITIHPPFWLTTWFFVLAFVVIAALIVLGTFLFGRWVQNNQLEKLRIMLHSQEEERKRIAIDLHDDLGGRLSSLKLFMQATQKKISGEPLESLKDTTKMLDEAIVELRNILFNLSPKSLDENGLEGTLEDLASNVERITSLSIETNIETQETPIARQVQYAIYRICQELINNTLKHAKASEIIISLVRRDDGLVFLYEDDGKGFITESANAGYGLTNIQTHAQAIFGELLIDSSLGKGTAVTLIIPPSAINFNTKPSYKS